MVNPVSFTFIASAPQDRRLIRRNAMQTVWRQRKAKRLQIHSQISIAKPRNLLAKVSQPLSTATPDIAPDHNNSQTGLGLIHDRDVGQAKLGMLWRSEALVNPASTTEGEESIVVRRHAKVKYGGGPGNELARRAAMSRSPSPMSPMRADEVDPFGVLPVVIEEEDWPLLHHCKSVFLC